MGLAAPTVTTDKPDYRPGETVIVSGDGFASSTNYDVPIIRPDGTIVKGGGAPFIPGWDTVTSDASGDFTYNYKLNGVEGLYEVRVYASPWSGDRTEIPLASTTFTDGEIHFTQCLNDTDNNNMVDNCDWGNGAINASNSVYVEGNGVPQRLFHQIDTAATHTIRLEYDFTKGDVYAYDFLTNVDETMDGNGRVLDECANLPGFVSSANCTSLFSGAVLASIPSDPFDAVSDRETPASRSFRVGCVPACIGTAMVTFPNLDRPTDTDPRSG